MAKKTTKKKTVKTRRVAVAKRVAKPRKAYKTSKVSVLGQPLAALQNSFDTVISYFK